MEVAVHQIQWEKEEVEAEEEREEEEEELQMRRKRQPETVSAADIGDAINGDVTEMVEEGEGTNSNYEISVPENGKSEDELCVPENGKFNDELSVPENGHVQVSDYEENDNIQSILINNQFHQNSKDNILSDIEILPVEKTVKDPEITLLSEDTINGDDTEILEDGDEDLNDLDVERVLKEQNTHDLFCPNCHSCITKRVILRKRKRSLKFSDEDGKRNKPEIVEESQLNVISEPTVNTTVDSSSQTPAADEYNRDTDPEVFRCLSCFSFFIPTGNGFKLFNVFGDKKEKENLQREQTSSVKKNWLSSLFAFRKGEMLLDKDVEENIAVVTGQVIDSSPSPLVKINLRLPDELSEHGEPENNKKLEVKKNVEVTFSEENTIFKPQQDGLQILVEPTKEESALKKSQPDQTLNTTNEKNDDRDWLFPESLSVYGESETNKDLVANLHSQTSKTIGVKQDMPSQSTVEVRNVGVIISSKDSSYSYGSPNNNVGTKVDIHIEKTQIANADGSSPSLTTSLLLPDTVTNSTKGFMGASERTSTGGDTIIIVTENPAQTPTSHQAQDIIASSGAGLSYITESTEDRDFRGVEVIKSIVYGGLVETVTSLGIVCSAAGSDTAIINIVALGFANLFGGLFIICHSLWDLKSDDHGLVTNQATENPPNQRTRIDKYRDLLGRRENFYFHATVAILSYIIFGLLAPIIYGFSFRQSNDRYYKLLTVSAASLLCIAVLAMGKAYVQRRPKPYVKTVFYYVSLGFMTSGVSYIAGDLIKSWLEKLGWLSSSADLSVPIGNLPVQTGWNYY